MLDDAVTIPPVGWHQELRPEDLIWVTSTTAAGTLSAGPDNIVVLDLQALEDWQIAPILLASQAEGRLDSSVVAFGEAAQIEAALKATVGYDLSFLLRPGNLSDEAARQFVYDSLVAVRTRQAGASPWSMRKLSARACPRRIAAEPRSPA